MPARAGRRARRAQSAHSAKRSRRASRDDRGITALYVAFLSLVAGYFLAERLLAAYVHPAHWAAAFVVAVAGYALVRVYYAARSRTPR